MKQFPTFLIRACTACVLGLAGLQSFGALSQQAYVKASNTGAGDRFGEAVAGAGDYLVVGAPQEDSNATGVNGDQADNTAFASGAAYVYVRSGTNWTQQAYLKASDSVSGWTFGTAVAISGDTLVVGAPGATNLAAGDNSSGAVYVFTRSGTNWTQQARLRASNAGGNFGEALSLWNDTLVVGARYEHCASTGVNGVQTNYTSFNSGAAYVFTRNAGTWTQQAYLKASNTGAGDQFGRALSVMGDTIVVSAPLEDSNATGVNGNELDNSANAAGAAYVFTRSGPFWTQQAYLKPSNTGVFDGFGSSVAVANDTIVVGASEEDSNANGVNGDGANDNAPDAGAAYVFVRNAGVWTQQAYLKASNAQPGDRFGFAVAVEGESMVVTAREEDSASPGVNGNQADNTAANSGAAYLFTRSGTNWGQQSYLKASNPGGSTDGFGLGDGFGTSVSVAGGNIVLGASLEASGATGVNGNQADDSQTRAGAAYVFVDAAPGSLYTSVPAPGANIDLGIVDEEANRPILIIGNKGPGTLRILGVSIDSPPGANILQFALTKCANDRDATHVDSSCRADLPFVIPGDGSVGPIRVLIFWAALADTNNLDTTLWVVCDDPVTPTISYRIVGIKKDTFDRTIEGTIIQALNRVSAQGNNRSPLLPKNGADLGSLPTTATFALEPGAPHSLTTEIPAYLGGGSVVLTNFTGDFTVSVLPVPNDTNHAFLRVESGGFTAPSFRLPSGLESGLNVLTFGPPEQSSGSLNLTNGQYEVTATATITNRLIPQGVTVRGNYTGVYDLQTRTASLVSDSKDLFTPSGMMALSRSTNGLWLTWANTNAVEHATSVTGPWQVLSNAVSPRLVQPTNTQQFFRIRSPAL